MFRSDFRVVSVRSTNLTVKTVIVFMAHVKTVLELKTHQISQDRDHLISDDLWKLRVDGVSALMKHETTPIDVRDTVLSQIERGNAYPDSRIKCWAHLSIELDYIPEFRILSLKAESAKPEMPVVPPLELNYHQYQDATGPRSHSARSPTSNKDYTQQPVMSLSARSASRNEPAAEEDDPPFEPNGVTAVLKPLSQMTMLERHEYWMKKKLEAIEIQRAEKEKENTCSFKPDMMHSKRSFKAVSSAGAKGLEAEAEHSDDLHPGGRSGVGAVAQRRNSLPVQNNSFSAVPQAASKWGLLRNKIKGSGFGAKKPKGVRRKSTAAREIDADGAVDADGDEGGDEADAHDEVEVSFAVQAVVEEPAVPEVPVKAPFVEGSFWWRIESGRGQHRVNDGGAFQMLSIYRKKDKTRDANGEIVL